MLPNLMNLTGETAQAVRAELYWTLGTARAHRVRTTRQFAEEEIVIPEGRYQGRKWRAYRQPYGALLFDCFDHGPWRRRAVCGCVQSGKTFHAFVVPIVYVLFELIEPVVVGVPTMDLAHDKWQDEILPVIRRTRYVDLLPLHGVGSRGGSRVEEITFRNGAKLKFMSGMGGDEKRSGFTARVVVATEVDKFDEAREASREADPISQLEGRTESYDQEAEIDLECTVSTKAGRIWQEYIQGTATRIVHPCPHCGRLVSPEREHLHGWQEAETKLQARREAYFCCPECAERLSEAQRRQMVQQSRLVHRGQETTPDGRIVGEPIETDTLGFRWSAFQNLFWSTGKIGAKEWAGARAEDEENAKKALLQFTWALPYEPPLWDDTPLVAAVVRKRFGRETKGLVPEDAKCLTVGVDLGKRVGWWVAIAWREDGSGHVVDYGTFEIPSDDLGVDRAMLAALRDLKENLILPGWATRPGQPRVADQVWIDAGYQGDRARGGDGTEPVYAFIREQGRDRRFRPTLGRGAGQEYRKSYTRPKKTGAEVKHIGEGYHVAWQPKHRVFVVEMNADLWKSQLHERLATPEDQPGALRFFHSTNPNEHVTISKHFTAEKIVEEFKPGKGLLRRWVRQSRANHYFDCAYAACAAGHLLGVRIIAESTPARTSGPTIRPTPVRRPDGRAFLITER